MQFCFDVKGNDDIRVCLKMGIYDNMDKIFKQYDFGFAIFKLTRQEMRVKQLNFNRLIENGLVNDN